MGDEAAQLQQLAQCLSSSLSPDQTQRQAAESFLEQGSSSKGFSILLLKLVASDGSDAQNRVAGAVAFKNLVKKHWVQQQPDIVGAPVPYCVADAEKDQVRQLLVGLMLSAPKLVRAQLSEALSIISVNDFPERWPGLLPELVQRLGQPNNRDWQVVTGVLETANTIFKQYRQAYKSDTLYKELKYVLDLFAAPLLELMKEGCAGLIAHTGDIATTTSLLISIRLICRIFFSLNSQELPEVFEDTMDAWMGEFHNLLAYENPGIISSADSASPLDAVKASVCDNVNLYIEKNEEEFQRFLQTFVQDVWQLLTKTGLESSKDHLVTSGVRFLTTVANSVHHSLFSSQDTLKTLCEQIVIPNLQFRDDDEELFDMNHVEYIRRDIEGSDGDTRRRGACELVRGLTNKFPEHMAQSVGGYVNQLLTQHQSDPQKFWKAKDAAIYLVTSLMVKSKSNAKGATELNNVGLNVVDFYASQIVPELVSAQNANGKTNGVVGTAVLWADALKFVTIFRGFLPKEQVLPVLPAVLTLLTANENVTHAYACNCLERLLTVRESDTSLRYSASDLLSHLNILFTNLFGVFELPDSRENEYAMKAVMRVITVLDTDVKPVALICLQKLSSQLLETCQNPKNPTFSHYLFESVAGVLKHAGDSALTQQIEHLLFPPFQHVLQQDIVEFAPYVFQLLSQMIENRADGAALPQVYLGIFPALLAPTLWDRQANVVPLVRLLEAFLRKAPTEIAQTSQLTGILGVFQKLAASRAQDHQGFFILNAFVECLPLAAWVAFLPSIWSVLFQRLQSSKTVKFTKCLVVFICVLCARHGTSTVSDSMAKVQPGIFEMLMKGVVCDAVPTVSGASEEKVIAVAVARFLSEAPSIISDHVTWAKLLTAATTTLEKSEEVKNAEAAARGESNDLDDALELAEKNAGYSASYSRLSNASRKEVDPCADVPDAKVHLAQKISQVSAQQPGVFGGAIRQNCPPEVQQALQGYCAAAGVGIN
tara:strand:+ start:15818 stop:18799 length:2982 start_codon:yes stop_codon:yes gene_type:complete